MKQITILLIAVSLILTSCSTVEFENIVPNAGEELSSFPTELVGEYIGNKNQDTLVITHSNFAYTMDRDSKSNDAGNVSELSDKALVLKQFDGYYILNLKSENDKNWAVLPIKLEQDSIKIFYILLDIKTDNKEGSAKYKKEKLKLLNSITDVALIQDTLNNVDNYLINPTDKEIREMLAKEIFSPIFTYTRLIR